MTAAADASRPRPSATRLTPERVRSMQFTRAPIGRRGLAEDEVLQFLQRVAEDIATRDADDAAARATITHYKNVLSNWQAEHGELRGDVFANAPRPTVEAVNILSRAQQEADSYVAQTQEYCRRLAVDARDHAQQVLNEAKARAAEAANLAVAEYQQRQLAEARGRAELDTQTPEHEELQRRLLWARTFLASLANAETQLRTAREALAFEFERLDVTSRPGTPAN